MLRNRSLVWHLVLVVVMLVGTSLVAFSTLTYVRLDAGAKTQKQAVTELARERISVQMRLQSQLVYSEFERIKTSSKRVMVDLAQRDNIVELMEGGNIVAIDLALKKARETSGLDGIIAVDTELKSLGSHQPGLNILQANLALRSTPFYDKAKELLANEQTGQIALLSQVMHVDKVYTEALALNDGTRGALMIASLQPVFDDFGDVLGLLIGHRIIKAQEPALIRFLESEGFGIRIIDGSEIIFEAGESVGQDSKSFSVELLKMDTTTDGNHLVKCALFATDWRLCIYEPKVRLAELTDRLVYMIDHERDSIAVWLALLSIASIVVATIASLMATRRVIAPLYRIRDAVRSVAKGNWLVEVGGLNRQDEVGEISRAIVVLQQSMKERERLKADVGDIEEVRAEKLRLFQIATECQTALRRRLFSLADLTEEVVAQASNLSGSSKLAEGELDESRLVIARTLTDATIDPEDCNLEDILSSFDRLGETLASLSNDTQSMSGTTNSINDEMARLGQVIKRFSASVSGSDNESDPGSPLKQAA